MSKVVVAACQYEPHVGDVEGNRDLAVRWATQAADKGAQLVVLPELASSGYVFESELEAAAASENLENGIFVKQLHDLARDRKLTIVVGVSEAGLNCRYNSGVVIDADGVRATYRKVHLFYNEQSWFKPGDKTVVVETEWGKVGVLICYDLWFPEVARSLALADADIIAVPTNWVSSFKPTVYDERGFCQGNYMAMASAAANGVAVVCADRIGEERGTKFLGASIVIAPDGWAVAGPASRDKEEVVIAELDLEDVAKARRRTPRNHLLEDRRPDSYNAVVVRSPSQSAASKTPL